ncbi:Flagellar hook-associated protein flgK [Candidatus Hydrogenisulfobacillus filiaventi]|uniref:Flagellar hook-associated protein flgK n=1 Tax=Candidatus Hydrogenisulfobacillus filiaventi TaxID=2707344 RepID=A0A6F8ZHS0_9FIRM|nr:Flagellar hook-associated protein flgK [Candidatus Hydrogenisulfobacillus filiaventi]
MRTRWRPRGFVSWGIDASLALILVTVGVAGVQIWKGIQAATAVHTAVDLALRTAAEETGGNPSVLPQVFPAALAAATGGTVTACGETAPGMGMMPGGSTPACGSGGFVVQIPGHVPLTVESVQAGQVVVERPLALGFGLALPLTVTTTERQVWLAPGQAQS